MNHTKGNWIENSGQIYPEETGKTIALIPYFDKEDEEQQANVKLMAASKELLEACEQVIESFDANNEFQWTEDHIKRICEEAINKATS